MPKRSFSLEPSGPKRLELSWSWGWKRFEAKLDGQSVGTAPDAAALKEGVLFALPDGSALRVRLRQAFANNGLEVERDGVPLPGSDDDPAERIRAAAYAVFFVAALSGVIGIVAAVTQADVLVQLGFGIGSAFIGFVFSILGFLTLRHSLPALIAALVLYALDYVIAFADAMSAGRNPGVGGLLVHIFLGMAMWRGIVALRAMRRTAQPA